jgi:propanol-preferring alcohol dehydrogenase
MKAMILEQLCDLTKNKTPLKYDEMPDPVPGPKELLLRVTACGVCHTELDEIEGRTPPPKLPVILGHQVVGDVHDVGPEAGRYKKGERVGVAWIFSACGQCALCQSGHENLCESFRATGRDADGGYAEYMTVSEEFAFKIPPGFTDTEAAPLLCAGAIGYRSMRLAALENGQSLGLTGFGASAHLVLKMAAHRYPATKIFVFARSEKEQMFARELGAFWAGHTEATSPEKLDAIIDTTPAWKPVVEALGNLKANGRLVINAIRKEISDQNYLMKLEYPVHLWMEKEIKSVANVARADVREFLDLAAEMNIKPEVQEFDLKDTNRALVELKERKIRGAKVLILK